MLPKDKGSVLDLSALPPERRQESQTLLSDLFHRLHVRSQPERGNTHFLFYMFDINPRQLLLSQGVNLLKCRQPPHPEAHTRHDLRSP